jgi:uncharacterized protein (DUF433 family)
MNLPNFLTWHPDGEIRLTGHRIGIYHLLCYYNEGDSAEMLACRFPTIPLPLVHKVLAFYLENRSEMDVYVKEYAVALEEEHARATPIDWNELRRRKSEMVSKAKV